MKKSALIFLKESRSLDIELFEQPTPKARPEQLGVVGKKTETPIMADESLLSLLDAFHLVKKGLIEHCAIVIQLQRQRKDLRFQ